MPTRNELSRAWGVTPQEISRLKKLGLPLEGTLADCEHWRGKHISRPRGRRRMPPKIVMTSPEKDSEFPDANIDRVHDKPRRLKALT